MDRLTERLAACYSGAVPDVGFAAGFRSQSQFYARFRDRCGEPPGADRRRLGVASR